MSALSLSSLAFPPSPEPRTRIGESLQLQGFALRAAVKQDFGFLRMLYGVLRVDELASVDWPEPVQQAFLDSQFVFQHHHFITHFAHAEFLVLEHDGYPLGRLYLLREAPRWLIIDIALLPTWQGRGIGATLLAQLQADAQNTGAQGLALHVRQDNDRAYALYVRSGFREECIEGMHRLMHWDVPTGLKVQLNTA